MLEESRREQRATQQEEVVAREALERLRQLKVWRFLVDFRAFPTENVQEPPKDVENSPI